MYAQLQQRGSPRPPVNVSTLQKMKAEGEKISSLTATEALTCDTEISKIRDLLEWR